MTITAGEAAIEVSGVSKSYDGVAAIEDIDLRLERGSLTALLGPSGCGKSTTLEIIAGLIAADRGDIVIDGVSMNKVPAEKRPVSLVFQKPLLFPHRTVAQNIAFGLRMRGVERPVIAGRVEEMLERVRLPGYGPRRVDELSGGQEQRVSLARALVLEPAVLLLDEPFSQLDVTLRGEMRQLVRELHEASDVTTLFVTHDQEEAVDLADEIQLMLAGRIEGRGTPEQIFTQPPSLRAARFFGVTNEMSGVVSAGMFTTAGGELSLPTDLADGVAVLTIRPESITVIDHPEETDVMTTTQSARFAGSHVVVVGLLDDGQALTARAPVGTPIRPGDRMALRVPADRCTVFGGGAA